MQPQAVQILEDGKLAIPAQFREELGLEVGDTVVVDVSDGELHVRSLSSAIQRAQAIVREFVPQGTDLTNQLIRERRGQAGRE